LHCPQQTFRPFATFAMTNMTTAEDLAEEWERLPYDGEESSVCQLCRHMGYSY